MKAYASSSTATDLSPSTLEGGTDCWEAKCWKCGGVRDGNTSGANDNSSSVKVKKVAGTASPLIRVCGLRSSSKKGCWQP